MPPTLALASCTSLPAWEVDDAPLRAALLSRGAILHEPAWDDATFDWRSIDLCVIRTTWDYVRRFDAFRAWIDRVDRATTLQNPATIVRWNLDKRYLRDLEAHHVPMIPTLWFEEPTDIDQLDWRGWLRGQNTPCGFLKPVVGASASGTLRFTLDDGGSVGLDAAEAHVRTQLAGDAPKPMMLQPYLDTVERDGELSFIAIDGAITHAVRKVPVAGDYRVQDDYGGRDELYAAPSGERALAERILAAVAPAIASSPRLAGVDATAVRFPLLYARIDLLRDRDGTLRLTELELVEPSLFFRHAREAAVRMADAIMKRWPVVR
ncbi:MAG: hypothetical protein U0575_02920 [Phycisphaerales bacterium]